jgi:hypothetical protein
MLGVADPAKASIMRCHSLPPRRLTLYETTNRNHYADLPLFFRGVLPPLLTVSYFLTPRHPIVMRIKF